MESLVGMVSDFWRNKRVLLTGHTGFKGAWLAQWLSLSGADVTGYALDPPTEPNLFAVADVGSSIRSIIGDVRDVDRLNNVMELAKPEIVFHLAAQSLVRRSYTDPAETYSVNVLGTVNVFEAIRRTRGVRAIVNISSDKCYVNQGTDGGYKEGDQLGGFDPYSTSKACSELVTAAYQQSLFAGNETALASARAGNVIGGGDWAEDRLFPDIIRSIESREAVKIRSPLAIRPWQHVLDPLNGYLTLAEKLWTDPDLAIGAWNFGPVDQPDRSVAWVVDRVTHLWGEGATWLRDDDPQPHESNILRLDSNKAVAGLGWYPCWSLEMALQHSVKWHKSLRDGADMHTQCQNDILAFQESLRHAAPAVKGFKVMRSEF